MSLSLIIITAVSCFVSSLCGNLIANQYLFFVFVCLFLLGFFFFFFFWGGGLFVCLFVFVLFFFVFLGFEQISCYFQIITSQRSNSRNRSKAKAINILKRIGAND